MPRWRPRLRHKRWIGDGCRSTALACLHWRDLPILASAFSQFTRAPHIGENHGYRLDNPYRLCGRPAGQVRHSRAGPRGFFLTAALGIAGSVITTYVGRALGWYAAGQSAGFIGAFVGAIVLLGIYHLVVKNRTPQV